MTYTLHTITIGELCKQGGGNVQTGPFGSQLKASSYVAGGIPTVMPVNLIDFRIKENGIARISPEDHKRLARHQLKPGDIVYGRRGDIGRHALVTKREDGWLCGTGCMRIRFGNAPVDPKFVSYYLRQQPVIDLILGMAVGTTMPNLNTSILESVPLELPPLPIQRRIAEILGRLDDKIEVNRRINRTLEQTAQALYQHWFVDFGPFQAGEFVESELGPIPKGWGVKPLVDALEVNPSRSLVRGQIAPYLEMGNMPTASARALAWEHRGFNSGMRFKNGDVLVARITPCLENGKTAFVDFLEDNQVGWGSTEYIVLRSKPPLPLEYAYCLARSDDFRTYAIQRMTGTSGRQRVAADSLSSYPVIVPPAAIAEQYGAKVRPMFAAMKRLDDESQKLAEIRDYLLPKLLSGAIPVEAAAETGVEQPTPS